MARSFNRRLARLLKVDDTVRNTVTSSFDSDQVVTIVSENASTGFDSDQVVAIINENSTASSGGLDSDSVKNITVKGYSEKEFFIQSSAPTVFAIGDFWWDRDGSVLSKASASTTFTTTLPAGTSSQYSSYTYNQYLAGGGTTSQAYTITGGPTGTFDNTGTSVWSATNRAELYTFTTPTVIWGINNVYEPAIWIWRIDYVDGSYMQGNSAGATSQPTQFIWYDSGGNTIKTYANNNGVRELTHPNGTKATSFVIAKGSYQTDTKYFTVFFQGADYWKEVGDMYIDSDTVRSYVTSTHTIFDSDQIVAIINENSSGGSGFDSDQVVAIIDENPSHPTISAASSVNNSGSTFIQDITLDAYGHITSLTSAEASGGDPYLAVNSSSTVASATGTNSIALGDETEASSTTTTAVGHNAVASATSATAVGADTNATASYALAVGSNCSVYAAEGVAIGYNCNARTGDISIGRSSGWGTNVNSQHNIKIGYAAGMQNNAQYGVNIGYYAGFASASNSTQNAQYNIMIGYRAGYYDMTGDHNIGMGYESLGKNQATVTSGNYNVCLGQRSGYEVTTGGENVCIGLEAGAGITSGTANVVIGSYAGNSTAQSPANYNILIGNSVNNSGGASYETVIAPGNYTGKGSNTAFMGGSSGTYNLGNSSSWNTASDERIKKNITSYTLGLNELNQVEVKTYEYRSDSDIAETYPELADSDGLVKEKLPLNKPIVGLIAQELEEILPNSVTTRTNGIKTVNKDELFWVMLNSIKELKARVEALENA